MSSNANARSSSASSCRPGGEVALPSGSTVGSPAVSSSSCAVSRGANSPRPPTRRSRTGSQDCAHCIYFR
jgi:hypothetical protein